MPETVWTARDRKQLRALGISEAEALRQLKLFASPRPAPVLERACRAGDGIRRMTQAEQARCIALARRAAASGRFMKFVPASGAASRMFQALLSARSGGMPVERKAVAAQARRDPAAKPVLAFMDGWTRLACADALRAALRRRGLDADALARRGKFAELIDALLTPEGLGYAELPKALLLFHRYPRGVRTSLEEHLVETAQYALDRKRRGRLHLTVSPEHRARVARFLRKAVPAHQRRLRARFATGLSVQKSSTDTIAAGADNRPFRAGDGRLVFRPGGHGALIENLNDLKADIVFIKNIDNVVPDHLKPETVRWKWVLAGLLIDLQSRVFGALGELRKRQDARALEDAVRLLEKAFGRTLPRSVGRASLARKRAAAIDLLDRPIRVCGVVKNEGEPGGGPFWVREREGGASLQIIEQAQVAATPGQRARFKSATHFNPVDIAAALRDGAGRPFDLNRFLDPDAVFIAEKSKDGRPLRALERPGLWNGAMAHWLTVFVEVPAATFNPVKTVNDLLRPAHQPSR